MALLLIRLPSPLSSSLDLYASHSRLFLSHRSFSLNPNPNPNPNPTRSIPLSVHCSQSGNTASSKVMLKDMEYSELEKCVRSHGFRPRQAMMLWTCLYENNVWAQSHDELQGFNKDFRRMLSENASFKALSVKDILTASDGTRKEVADLLHWQDGLEETFKNS